MAIPLHNLSDEAGRRAAEELVEKLRLGTALVAGSIKPTGRADPNRAVARIIQAVRRDGDDALIRFTRRFDKVKLDAARLRVSADELAAAHGRADPKFLAAARAAIANIRAYQAAIRPAEPPPLRGAGMSERLRLVPLDRVGCYVPGGTAPLASSVMMLAVPAQAAGVRQIAVASPPRGMARSRRPCGVESSADIHPAILAVCHELGIDEVYRVGGAQAIAALAVGTQTIQRVDKVVGPGNLYVQLAKKQLYGQIAIDSFAGPSEVLILADGSANPTWLAADLLAQAEHDPGCGLLVTPDAALAAAVAKSVGELLARCSRRKAIEQSLAQWSAIFLTDSLDQAIDWANRIAPEHLQIVTADDESALARIRHAGAVFLGPFSPVATGDYVAGSSHVLPTGGTARYFAGLSVFDFLRPVGVIRYERDGLAAAADSIAALATAEGLDAHALSVRIRLGPKPEH